jgi:hypothetical protein
MLGSGLGEVFKITSFRLWPLQAKRSDKSNKLAEWFKMEGPQDNDDLTEFFCDDGWATEDMKLLDPAALTWRVNFDGSPL